MGTWTADKDEDCKKTERSTHFLSQLSFNILFQGNSIVKYYLL